MMPLDQFGNKLMMRTSNMWMLQTHAKIHMIVMMIKFALFTIGNTTINMMSCKDAGTSQYVKTVRELSPSTCLMKESFNFSAMKNL